MKVLTITLLHFCILSIVSAHTFEITYEMPKDEPLYTPRVYIAAIPNDTKQDLFNTPRRQLTNFIDLPILFSVDDTDRDGKVTIDKNTLGTIPISDLNNLYKVQAIVRINPDWWMPGHGTGDLYSLPKLIDFSDHPNITLNFTADQVKDPPPFRSQGNIQDHFFKSEKLSKFHGRDYHLRYSVILPDNWDKTKQYPVIVNVLGFTGVHHEATDLTQDLFGKKGKKAIIVIPDANCRWGHSVFANSAINGPWGDALTSELLPYIDETYGGAGPEHRYITGVSSGGWAAAWAIVNYPDAYAGSWAIAPDPVDFEKFQELNFTDDQPDHLYLTTDKRKHSDRLFTIPQMKFSYKSLATFEHVLGPGGQLQSFGAVFSPEATSTGNPIDWYDVDSGKINMKVTDAWSPYDISRILQENWKELKPKLKGKMHFGVHSTDIFYLDRAVRLLEKDCRKLRSDATFTYYNGIGHHMPKPEADKMMSVVLKKWNKRKRIK